MKQFIIKEPQKVPTVKMIEEDALCMLIGGFVDIVNLPNRRDIVVILDDEGILKELAPNFYVNDYIIAGKVIFAAERNGALIDLNTEQIDYIKQYLNQFEFKGEPNSINYNDYLLKHL